MFEAEVQRRALPEEIREMAEDGMQCEGVVRHSKYGNPTGTTRMKKDLN